LRYELGDTVDQRRKYVQGKGCAHCGGTGYSGRTGVYEMLEMTNEIVEASTATIPDLRTGRAQADGRRNAAPRCRALWWSKAGRRSKKRCASAISLKTDHADLRLQST
jgi:type II secretory ATPase GspE/PulE/Tfp pilus assembly ATPase PilB-like protein